MTTLKLTSKSYAPYGSVIMADDTASFVYTNMNTAKRYNFLADLQNLRSSAKPNLCVFRCKPYSQNPIEIKLLERHEFSTQVFIPMNGTGRYLLVVCQGNEKPDLNTLSVFIADGTQGISYKPGIWHHPMIALDQESDFTCLVWEDGTKGDCETFNLEQSLFISLP